MNKNKNLLLEDKQWLISSYSSKSTRQIAKELGCSQSAISKALHRHGVKTRPPGRFTAEKLKNKEWLAEAYKTRTTRSIAKEIGCSATAVAYALKRYNVKLRPPVRKVLPEIMADYEWMSKRYSEVSTVIMGRELECSPTTILAALNKLGISTKIIPTKPTPYKQKIGPDGKPKKEHRLIMEQHLGRKLDTNEHVHHIDGNKRNNNLENLIILTKSSHCSLHGNKRQKVCFICDKSFIGPPNGKYCSDSCRIINKVRLRSRRND